METVRIWHPDIPETVTRPVTVSERAFDITWSQPEPPHRPQPWQIWPPDLELTVHADALARAFEQADGDTSQAIRLLAAAGIDRQAAAEMIARLTARPEPPPRSGPGSGRGRWADYAASIGITVGEDDSKADIVAKVQADNPAKEQ